MGKKSPVCLFLCRGARLCLKLCASVCPQPFAPTFILREPAPQSLTRSAEVLQRSSVSLRKQRYVLSHSHQIFLRQAILDRERKWMILLLLLINFCIFQSMLFIQDPVFQCTNTLFSKFNKGSFA